jgi:hypothetical protein
MPEVILRKLGERGADLFQDTNPHTGNWQGIQIVTNTVFTTLTSTSISGTLTGITWPACFFLRGAFTAITLASGIVLADKAETIT